MRTTVLIAASLLLAGCAPASVGGSDQASTAVPTRTAPTRASAAPDASVPPAGPKAAPADGAAIADVLSWVAAGKAADAARFHTATRDGAGTDLGSEVAFSVAAGAARPTICMTEAGVLACQVNLATPPTQPAEVYGGWRGGWVDFPGATLQVGSAHSDPGRFMAGAGPDLPNGSTLAFGDYRCRADATGLYCVNYAHRTAARLSPAGVVPFGCLQPVPPPADAGRLFRCAS